MKKLLIRIGLGVVASTVLFLTFNRLKFGFLWQDESYYLSLVYRLALGDRFSPYSPTDFFAYLIFPLTTLYLKVFSHALGLMYFSRLIYWFYTLGVGLFIYLGLSRHLDRKLSFLLSLIYPCYLHYYPVLFYTNLGVGLLTSALFLSLIAIKTKRCVPYFGLIGLLLGFAAISHPGGIPIAILAFIFGLKNTGHLSKQNFCFMMLGLFFSLFTFFFISGFSPIEVLRSVRIVLVNSEKTGMTLNLKKIFLVCKWFVECSPFNGPIMFIWVVPLILYFTKKRWVGYFFSICFVPIIYIFVFRGIGRLSSQFQIQALAGGGDGALVRYISIVGLFIYFSIRKTLKLSNSLYHLVALPSFAAAFGLAFSSNTLMGNLGIGCLPAFICATVFLFLFIQTYLPERPTLSFLPVLNLLFILIPFMNLKKDYNRNFVKVTEGVYAGMMTDENIKQLNSQFTHFFKSEKLPSEGRIFFNGSPLMGYSYLYTQLKPGVAITWGCFMGPEICNKLQQPFNKDITVILNFDKSKIELENANDFEFKKTVRNIDVYLRKNNPPSPLS